MDDSAYACAVPSAFTYLTIYGPKLMTLTAAKHVHRHEKAPIESLPVELLLAIFREVISIPNQSRLTLAYVCSTWKNIVLLMPEFWTCLTVFIDSPFFSLSSIASAFARSSKFILEHVTVTRNTWTLTEDEREKERVASVLQIINSNMHRCHSISFQVLFSSSLPSFPDDFHGPAKHLEYLELTCMKDDGGALTGVNETSLSATQHEPFRCPKLSQLVIDGRNYFNAWQRNLDLKEIFPDVMSLWISHFTPAANRSESFTTSDLLRSLVPFQENLTSLCIDDVHLDDSTTPALENVNFGCFETIEFENMHNTDSMQQILDFIRGPADVHITRCRLYPNYNCQGSLSLAEIDACEDLVAFLKNCACVVEKLTIKNCPGFGDDVLHAMMTPSQSLTMLYCMPHVKELSITDCKGFSISTLKELVETRRICGVAPSPPRPIDVILLSGLVPDVSPEDRDWFKGHLSKFSYN